MPKQVKQVQGHPNRNNHVVVTPAAVVVHHGPAPITPAHALHVAHGGIHKKPHKHKHSHVSHTRTLVAPHAAHAAPPIAPPPVMLVQYPQAVAPVIPVPVAPAPPHGTVTHTQRFVKR